MRRSWSDKEAVLSGRKVRKIIRSRCWDKVSKKGVDGEHKFKIKDIFDIPQEQNRLRHRKLQAVQNDWNRGAVGPANRVFGQRVTDIGNIAFCQTWWCTP